mgnify:CR=1 FL=1
MLPYLGLNINTSSEIDLKPSSSTSKKSSLQRVPLKIKTIPNKLKIKKSFKSKYSTDRANNISEKMKYKNRSSMSTKSRKTSCRSKSYTKSLIKNDTGDKILSEQKFQNNLTENSKQKQTDVGAAVCDASNLQILTAKLRGDTSIYTVELYAVKMALTYIKNNTSKMLQLIY